MEKKRNISSCLCCSLNKALQQKTQKQTRRLGEQHEEATHGIHRLLASVTPGRCQKLTPIETDACTNSDRLLVNRRLSCEGGEAVSDAWNFVKQFAAPSSFCRRIYRITLQPQHVCYLRVCGGAENGRFVCISDSSNELCLYGFRSGDVILEVDAQNVAGYSKTDVQTLLRYYIKQNRSVGLTLAAVASGALTNDLRVYLRKNFARDSFDARLQNTIRDNLYIRTIPCTTRPPRAGEVDGVDYQFLSKTKFFALEREGKLIESGVFQGNYYGTPLPGATIRDHTPADDILSSVTGAALSSKGKRRRNRSNVEAFLSFSGSFKTVTQYYLNDNLLGELEMAPSTSGNLEQLTGTAASDVPSAAQGRVKHTNKNERDEYGSNGPASSVADEKVNTQRESDNVLFIDGHDTSRSRQIPDDEKSRPVGSSSEHNCNNSNKNDSEFDFINNNTRDPNSALNSDNISYGPINNTDSNQQSSAQVRHGFSRSHDELDYAEESTIVDDDLGPLPPHWEKAYTEHGEPYFINLDAGTSQWDDPRLTAGSCETTDFTTGDPQSSIGSALVPIDSMEQLPYGWERIDDPQYGTYYIDHINKRTQYESPFSTQQSASAETSQILSGNTVLNTSGSTLSIAMSCSVRGDDDVLPSVPQVFGIGSVSPRAHPVSLENSRPTHTAQANSVAVFNEHPFMHSLLPGTCHTLFCDKAEVSEGAKTDAIGKPCVKQDLPFAEKSDDRNGIQNSQTYSLQASSGDCSEAKVFDTYLLVKRAAGTLEDQQHSEGKVQTSVVCRDPQYAMNVEKQFRDHSLARKINTSSPESCLNLKDGQCLDSAANTSRTGTSKEEPFPHYVVLSKNLCSDGDPLYATIGPKGDSKATRPAQIDRVAFIKHEKCEVKSHNDENTYLFMQPHINHNEANLVTLHNYVNVVEPQYRMSEGLRHRENGMVSCGDYGDTANESQVTENDSVFTNGGGHPDTDISTKDGPNVMQMSKNGMKSRDANLIDDGKKLDIAGSDKEAQAITPIDSSRANRCVILDRKGLGAECGASGQMNSSRDGILALMPCLASCMQEKRFGLPGDDYVKGDKLSHFQLEDISDHGGGAGSKPDSQVQSATACISRSSSAVEPRTHISVPSHTSNNSACFSEGKDNRRVSQREEPAKHVSRKLLGKGVGDFKEGSEGLIRASHHNDDNGNKGNLESGLSLQKIPPPTLPKPAIVSPNAGSVQVSASSPSQQFLPPQYQLPYVFTRNPAELVGEIVHVSLIKSPRGFGFTIIGGNDHQAEEFLQIKSITPGGPAWNDGALRTGDVLVHVNGICVLGYTHGDVVSLFQSIAPGEMVHLQICRGYKLPFDPEDPNMEIVTTQAVTATDTPFNDHVESNEILVNRSVVGASQDYQDIYGTVMRKIQSIDLSKGSLGGSAAVGTSAATLGSANIKHHNNLHEESASAVGVASTTCVANGPAYLTVEIVKGNTGFGFTIADSCSGQKVKKILDEARCQDLAEGDILIDINGRDVRNRLHSEVVQVLKECLVGSTARITVERGGSVKLLKNSSATIDSRPNGLSVDEELGSDRASHASTSFSQFNFTTNPGNGHTTLYRSKTPTAELYSSAREVVVQQRPKTPVLDSRNWDSSCPEKPPRTGPQQPYAVQSLSTQHNGGAEQTMLRAGDMSVNNSIYGTVLVSGINGSATYGNVLGATGGNERDLEHEVREVHDDEVYGQLRSKSDVWHYDYPTSAGARSQRFHGVQSVTFGAENSLLQNGDYANYCSNFAPLYDAAPRAAPIQSAYNHPASASASCQLLDQQQFLQRQAIYGGAENIQYAPTAAANLQRPCSVQGSSVSGLAQESTVNGEFQVTLHKKESGFGFRIVGGTEEGSQVTIGHIVPGGAADLDGTIATGDEILSVDNHSVANASHHHVVQLMASAALVGHVTLGLLRRRPYSTNLNGTYGQSGVMLSHGDGWHTFNVILERTESEGFGFVIISSIGKSGSAIGRIIEGSPAERCGRLRVGDRIHAVNGVSILDMHHEDIVNLIKVSGLSVSLTVVPRSPRDYGALSTASNASIANATHMPDDLSSIGTSRPVGPEDFHDTICVGNANDSGSGSMTGDRGKTSAMRQSISRSSPPVLAASCGPCEFRRVILQRGARGFGFSIRGGREFHNMPLFVLRIAEMGPAQVSGQLRVGDQLLEVNGICTDGMTHAEAIGLIRQGGNTVTLLIKRNPPDHAASQSTRSLRSPIVEHEFPQQQEQQLLTVESPPSLLSHQSLGGPISQSSPRVQTAMLVHPQHGTSLSGGSVNSVQFLPHQVSSQHAIYGAHSQWAG